MPTLRRAARASFILVIALGLLTVVAGLTWSRWAPGILADRVEQIASEAGVALSVERVSARLDGRISLAGVVVEHERGTVRCARVDGVVAGLRTPHPVSTTARDCRVTPHAGAATPDVTPGAASPLVPDPSGLVDAAEALVARLGEVTVDTAVIDGVGNVDLHVERATLRRGDDGLHAFARFELRSPLVLVGEVRATLDPDGVHVGAVRELQRGGLTVAWDEASWRRDAIGVEGLTVQRGDVWASLTTARISGTRATPRIEAGGGTIAFERPAPPAEPEPATAAPPVDPGAEPVDPGAEPADPATTVGPSPGQRMATRLGERLDAARVLLAAARAAPVPSLDVDAGTFVVTGLLPIDIELGSLRYTPTGDLSFDAGLGDVALRAHTSLPALDAITFTAEHVDLTPLSQALGARTDVGGRLDASGTLVVGHRMTFDGTWHVRDGRLVHPGISPAPLDGLDASGAITFDAGPAADGRAELDLDASIRIGDAAADLTLALRPDADTWTLAATFAVPEATPCQAMWQAIPAGLLPDLGHEAVSFVGEAAPRLEGTYRMGDTDSFRLRASGFPGTCAFDHIDAAWDPAQLLDDTWSHHVTEGVTRDDVFVGPGGTEGWVAIAEVPAWLPALMYLSEEIDFPTNPGISIGLINRGIRMNLERGRYAYGGSTVSQQLVKNLFFTRDKTLARKLQEAVITWAMEDALPKERILELYMNCVEFGPDIYGVVAAAEYYFGRPPWELTPLDAAFLATLKPAPLEGRVYRERGYSPDHGWWPERLQELLQRLVDFGGFLPPDDVAWYAPWVAVFPVSPNIDTIPYTYRTRAPKPELGPAEPLVRPRRALRRSSHTEGP